MKYYMSRIDQGMCTQGDNVRLEDLVAAVGEVIVDYYETNAESDGLAMGFELAWEGQQNEQMVAVLVLCNAVECNRIEY